MEPQFATTICPVGDALELRWQSALGQVEQEIQRCRNNQDSWVRWDLITFSIVNKGSTASYYYCLEKQITRNSMNVKLCQGASSVLLHWIHFSPSPLRFQTDFGFITEWLDGASRLLKTWSNLVNTSDVTQECVYNHLIKLLVIFRCFLLY